MADTKYQEFFRTMLSKHGYNSPKDIPKEKKDDFFNLIDRKWKAKEETDESLSKASYLNGRIDSCTERWSETD